MASIYEGPQCPKASGYCLAREAADSLGSEVYETLMTLIRGAEPGARLVLERGQTDFSPGHSGAPRTGIDSDHWATSAEVGETTQNKT